MYAYQNRLFASALPFASSFSLSTYTRAVCPGSAWPFATSSFVSVFEGSASAGFATGSAFVVKSEIGFAVCPKLMAEPSFRTILMPAYRERTSTGWSYAFEQAKLAPVGSASLHTS